MEQKEYRLAAIMYTDIAGFSRMMEENESATLDTLRFHNQLISDSVKSHGGRVIKTVGDVFLCEFPNTADAVKCAIEVQEGVGDYNADAAMPLSLRIGVHLGDIYFFEDDAYGEGVNIASRLQSLAKPGRICISQDVYNLVSSKLALTTEHLGQVKLKNISRELEAYEIVVASAAERPGGAKPGADGGSVRGALRENLASPEYADFNELKALVLQEIKRAGRRLSVDDIRSRFGQRSDELDQALESLADKGFLTRVRRESGASDYGLVREPLTPPRPPHAPARSGERFEKRWDREWGQHGHNAEEEKRIQSKWDQALETTPQPVDAGGYDRLVEDYKDHAAAAAEREKAGFRGHLISYLAVNGGLFFLWSMVMFGGFPWFLIVALAWGIGLASHFAGVKQKVRETKELDQWPALTREQLRIYRKLVKARNNWNSHLVSNVATSIFLLALNAIVSPAFPWALFPVGFMAIGIFSHLPSFKSKERRLLKRLRDAGARIGHLLRGKKASAEPEPVARSAAPGTAGYQAEQVRQRIIAKIEGLPNGSPLGDDFVPVLDNYVEQIQLLDQKNRELDQIMSGIPLASLERDLASLQKERAGTENEKVLAEYDRSIMQIRKQQSSFTELKNEREILRLRLSSSLNQLKQMEIDLARMQSLSSDEEAASLGMLKDKSSELSQYLDDLEAGYRELE
jgi:class 3 adenylate cyclase